MHRSFCFEVKKDDINMSIKEYLLEHSIPMPVISYLKRSDTGILINGKLEYTDYLLKENDNLEINLVDEADYDSIVPTKLDFTILYEDQDIIVIDKPAYMPVHPSKSNFTGSLQNALAYYYKQKGESVFTHCINRLDKNTTGLVLIAKNRISAAILYDDISRKEVSRSYYALVEGKFDVLEGTIDAGISKIEKDIKRQIDLENGKRAITDYKVVSYNQENNCSLVECNLRTGRTHQIRLHLKYIGHPLLGDFLYNKENTQMARQGLHGYKLVFTHPITKEKMEFASPIPNDFKEMIDC